MPVAAAGAPPSDSDEADARQYRRGTFGCVVLSAYDARSCVKLFFNRAAAPDDWSFAGLNEIELLRSAAHPHVVALHGVTALDDFAAQSTFEPVVMHMERFGVAANEFCGDVENAARVRRTAPAVAAQLAAAVAHLHERVGVAHGDLRLENVLCRYGARARVQLKLCDFGNARRLWRPLAPLVETAVVAYSAPRELVGARAPPSRVMMMRDWFAAAVCLYLMCVGNDARVHALLEACAALFGANALDTLTRVLTTAYACGETRAPVMRVVRAWFRRSAAHVSGGGAPHDGAEAAVLPAHLPADAAAPLAGRATLHEWIAHRVGTTNEPIGTRNELRARFACTDDALFRDVFAYMWRADAPAAGSE